MGKNFTPAIVLFAVILGLIWYSNQATGGDIISQNISNSQITNTIDKTQAIGDISSARAAFNPKSVQEPAKPQIDPAMINFEFASMTLTKNASEDLMPITEFYSDNPSAKIIVTGYSDVVGDPAANRKISKDRAVTVAKYLQAHGVQPGKILVKAATEKATDEMARTVEVKVIN